MRRLPELAISLALAACTSGSMQEPVETPPAAVLLPVPVQGPIVPDHVQALIALDEDAVRDLIGEPEFVWNQAGAAMWRYRGQACFLDVFLYDGKGVTFVDVRGEGIDNVTRANCFRSLVETRTAPG